MDKIPSGRKPQNNSKPGKYITTEETET